MNVRNFKNHLNSFLGMDNFKIYTSEFLGKNFFQWLLAYFGVCQYLYLNIDFFFFFGHKWPSAHCALLLVCAVDCVKCRLMSMCVDCQQVLQTHLSCKHFWKQLISQFEGRNMLVRFNSDTIIGCESCKAHWMPDNRQWLALWVLMIGKWAAIPDWPEEPIQIC